MRVSTEFFISQHPNKGHDRVHSDNDLIAIFDGAGNDRASEACNEELRSSDGNFDELGAIVQSLDEIAFKKRSQTTLVLARAVLKAPGKKTVQIANCGDSYIYMLNNEGVLDLSRPEKIEDGYIDTYYFLGGVKRSLGGPDRNSNLALNTELDDADTSVIREIEVDQNMTVILASDGFRPYFISEAYNVLDQQPGHITIEGLARCANIRMLTGSEEIGKFTHTPMPDGLMDTRDDASLAIMNITV